MSDDSHVSEPKRVRYEIWGGAEAFADISYPDEKGTPHQINGVPLPWSVEIVSNSPAMAGNILAQGDGDFIGCRITADGAVETERNRQPDQRLGGLPREVRMSPSQAGISRTHVHTARG